MEDKRQTKDVHVPFRRDLYDQIERIAVEEGRPFSWQVNRIVEQWLAARKGAKSK